MTKESIVKPVKDTKKRDLVLGLLFDAIGFISYAVPFLGELTDLVWAPIAGLKELLEQLVEYPFLLKN